MPVAKKDGGTTEALNSVPYNFLRNSQKLERKNLLIIYNDQYFLIFK